MHNRIKKIVASDNCLVFTKGIPQRSRVILEWCFPRVAKGKTLIIDSNAMVGNAWPAYLDNFRKVMFYKIVNVKNIDSIFSDTTSDLFVLPDHLLFRLVEEIKRRSRGSGKSYVPFSQIVIADFSLFKHYHTKKSKALHLGLYEGFGIQNTICVCPGSVEFLQIWGALKIVGKIDISRYQFVNRYFDRVGQFGDLVIKPSKKQELSELIVSNSSVLLDKNKVVKGKR